MADDINDTVTLKIDNSGNLYIPCQVTDYILRGKSLDHMNIVTFFSGTYDKKTNVIERNLDGLPNLHANQVWYMPDHPRHQTHVRCICPVDHNTLPNFVGGSFPRNDNPDVYEYYCAAMLLLFKPWRTLECDLKDRNESWASAFSNFNLVAPISIQRMISNIQYFHKTSANNDHDVDDAENPVDQSLLHQTRDDGLGSNPIQDDISPIMTETDLQILLNKETSPRERQSAKDAMAIARVHGIFIRPNKSNGSSDVQQDGVRLAIKSDFESLSIWRKQMDDLINTKYEEERSITCPSIQPSEPGNVTLFDVNMSDIATSGSVFPVVESNPNTGEMAAEEVVLNEEQQHAYDLVSSHLNLTLANENPGPLRMIIYGEGGTGKSKIIQLLTSKFVKLGCRGLLIKSAYTGV